MKKLIFKSFGLIALFGMTMSLNSCSGDDDNSNGGGDDVNNLVGTVLQGVITEDLNVPSGNYSLKGVVKVASGATLTIEPGTVFTVSAADQAAGDNYLVAERGAKIIAEGTASSPIVFTSQSGEPGSWGGIILNGYAKINAPGGETVAEAGGLTFGGNDNSDNSGSLKFVRVEYAGAAITGGTGEYNAFSLFGVGSGTTLENCQAYKGTDDGFEFFGGTVSGTNLYAFGCDDDSFDWDLGYTGTLTNLYVYQLDSVGDFGFECSNAPSEFVTATPRSNPNVSNVTVRGSGKAGKAAFTFKEGTAGNINNVKVTNVDYGVLLNNQLTEYSNGSLKITNGNISFATGLVKNNVDGTDASSLVSVNPSSTGANLTVFSGNWIREN